ncbi:sugar ABC transporter permease [Anaerocolumna sp. AGMB13025]|uniref:carbohydrate ABC transporter permease n=1 Tax=Anaerocolumna sp. AGMB13025 TaxID=3039116 RepID=UPI00241C1EBE|nr:sugar ABC transporter permease [Anaerocolumna sp. AGMB13025]WFR56538.1 sugar ABC transporter permease [Anaerocolumna sp. AGMB13025]
MVRNEHKQNKYNKKLRKRKVSEAGKAWLFLLPSFLGVIFFVLLPFADVIRRSFCEAMSSRFVGLSNYRLVLHNAAFLLAVKNTGRFLLTCIPLLLAVSFLLSLLLYYQKKHTEFFKTSFLLPMAIPVASVVLLWRLLFHENGLINVLLLHLGKDKIDFMNTSKAFLVLGFSYLWKNTGYNVILWLTGLNGISVNLYEAAGVDGAGFFAKLRYITLPQLLPSVYVITILSFVNSFKVFREAYLVAGDYPHESIYMLQHLFNNWFVNLDVQKMSAAAVMCVVIFVILILLFKKIDRDGED